MRGGTAAASRHGMQREPASPIDGAAHAARRFQLMARLHMLRPNARAMERDGQALIDALWRIGYRPQVPGGAGDWSS